MLNGKLMAIFEIKLISAALSLAVSRAVTTYFMLSKWLRVAISSHPNDLFAAVFLAIATAIFSSLCLTYPTHSSTVAIAATATAAASAILLNLECILIMT